MGNSPKTSGRSSKRRDPNGGGGRLKGWS